MQRYDRLRFVAALLTVAGARAGAQTPPDAGAPPPPEPKRIFGIIPNFRTSPFPHPYHPLPAHEKFNLAFQDSFDRGTIALGFLFGAEGLLLDSNPAFGHGGEAYARYAGTSYADFAIGDYMTEAIFPALLHQDPRYFRRGSGRGWTRLGYAMGQVFWTHNDSGSTGFNYSEIGGNATAVAISNAYYPDSRTVENAASKLAMQFGVDAAANVLKEFWPDLRRKLRLDREDH